MEDSTLAIESPSSSPSSLSLPVELEEPADEDHGFGFNLLYESSANTTSGLDALGFDEGLAGGRGENDDFGRHIHQDEGFFYPVVDFILHHVVQDEANRYGSVPASKAAVAALPTLPFSKDCFQEDDACCAICREVFEFGEEVKELPCQHIYHSGCILPWLELHSSCPLCRRDLPVEDAPGAYVEESMIPPTEAGEASLALFEISGEGIHVLSFVLFGAQTNEEENLQTHELTGDIELHGEERASAVADLENENEFSILDNQEARIDPKAGSGNLEASVALSMREEVVTDTRLTNHVETSRIDLSETVYSGDESALQYANGGFERSNNVTEGVQSTESTSQLTRAQFSTIDRLGSSIDRGTRGVQFTAFEDHDVSGLESSSGSSNLESSFAPRVRNFFSWVFGSPSHMVNSDGVNTGRHSFW